MDQGVAVLDAIGILFKARIVDEIGLADRLAEALPNSFAGNADDQIAIRGLKTLVRHDGRMGVAPTAGNVAVYEVIAAGVDQHGNSRFEQRGVDCWSQAGVYP